MSFRFISDRSQPRKAVVRMADVRELNIIENNGDRKKGQIAARASPAAEFHGFFARAKGEKCIYT
jgi:hypothetical protein